MRHSFIIVALIIIIIEWLSNVMSYAFQPTVHAALGASSCRYHEQIMKT